MNRTTPGEASTVDSDRSEVVPDATEPATNPPAATGYESVGRASGAGLSSQAAAHAVLGLLVLADGDRENADSNAVAGQGYGYDLARHFGPGQPLADVIRLEPGMLYHHLKRLDRAGLVEGRLEPQGTRPPRQVYRITAAGQAELRRWLGEPVARTREIRLDFLVKLYFARRLDPALAARLVGEQDERLRRLERSMTAQRDTATAAIAAPDVTGDARFRLHVLELRLAQTRAALAWLERIDESLVLGR